jgi:chloramphenicol 3-O phosphotransferase
MVGFGGAPGGRVLVINGTSSSGKTELARAIQAGSEEPWIAAGIDAFWNMIPAPWLEPGGCDGEGLSFGREDHDGHSVVRTRCGPIIRRVAVGMRHCVAALASAGCDVVCDDAFLDPSWPGEWAAALDGVSAWLIGLHCPADVLDAREGCRGDRLAGQARGQADIVHNGMTYDLTFDSSLLSPEAMAADVLEAIRHQPPEAFSQLRRVRDGQQEG